MLNNIDVNENYANLTSRKNAPISSVSVHIKQMGSVFSTSDVTEAQQNFEAAASEKLITIAREAKRENEAANDNLKRTAAWAGVGGAAGITGGVILLKAAGATGTAAVANGWHPGGWVLGTGAVLLLIAGGTVMAIHGNNNEKTRAEHSIMQAKGHTPFDASDIKPEYNMSAADNIINIIAPPGFYDKKESALTQKELEKYAKKALKSEEIETKSVYKIIPQSTDGRDNNTIKILIAENDATKYNGLPTEGISTETIELPQQYADFINTYLDTNKLSFNSISKLKDTLKAINSTGFNHEQAKKSGLEKEDVDFFDISGDGQLNAADIRVLQLIVDLKNEKYSNDTIQNITTYQPDLKTLADKFRMTQAEILNRFDLNDDGNITNEDIAKFNDLANKYKNKSNNIPVPTQLSDNMAPAIFETIDNADIDGDGEINQKDVALITNYFIGLTKHIKSEKEHISMFDEIVGGNEHQVRLTQALNN